MMMMMMMLGTNILLKKTVCVCKSKLMVIAFLFFHYSHIIKLSPINITTKYNAYVMYVN